jgi:uracil-DNA glycosylase
MVPTNLQNDLMEIWKDIFDCRRCLLPGNYTPQFRPVGSSFHTGGVVFAQINPGHIGSLTQIEIEQRYKTTNSRQIALHKQKVTDRLITLQNVFSKSPSKANWNQLNSAYNNAVCKIWGWPPGKYMDTIEKHGVKIDKVALINLAQCPVPKDKYTKRNFANCWQLHTNRLLEALKPNLIVAQGKAVLSFLQEQKFKSISVLVEGNHHASRQSNKIKNQIFHEVKGLVKRYRA